MRAQCKNDGFQTKKTLLIQSWIDLFGENLEKSAGICMSVIGAIALQLLSWNCATVHFAAASSWPFYM